MNDWLIDILSNNADSDAIVWRNQVFTHGWLRDRVRHWRGYLEEDRVCSGEVVALEADFSPNAVALFVALMGNGNILVPLSNTVAAHKAECLDLAGAGRVVTVGRDDDVVSWESGERHSDHPLYVTLREGKSPGLVLFSSGSTGKSKATVHDLGRILDKFKTPRHCHRMIGFLLFDHIGGINTMLYALSNGGCLVTVAARTPNAVLGAIERHRADVLPTSPTFINLILLSRAYEGYDLESLRLVTYGTEPMPESTLRRFHEQFPDIGLLQTYGLSEVGILRSQSRSPTSLWVRLGGDGFETRVVEGLLEIKARSAMLGYLNAPSPFTDDGWFRTGDAVEMDGDYLKILGRQSEMIIVGGEKVYPQEVESAILEMNNVAEVMVYGEKNAIVGNIVCAKIRLELEEDRRVLAIRLKRHCASRLERYKVPLKIIVSDDEQCGERFKKQRI